MVRYVDWEGHTSTRRETFCVCLRWHPSSERLATLTGIVREIWQHCCQLSSGANCKSLEKVYEFLGIIRVAGLHDTLLSLQFLLILPVEKDLVEILKCNTELFFFSFSVGWLRRFHCACVCFLKIILFLLDHTPSVRNVFLISCSYYTMICNEFLFYSFSFIFQFHMLCCVRTL